MTDELLMKLEEKMMTLLVELENLRKETQRLKHENQHLKTEYSNHTKKLQDLISLLDSLNSTPPVATMLHERDFLEGAIEYATA